MRARWSWAAIVAAALWSVVFAGLHGYWAFGGRVLLGDSPAARAAFANPVFAIYNAVAGVLCLVGLVAVLALAPSTRVTAKVRRIALGCVGLGCVLLVARGGIGVVQTLAGLAPPPERRAAYDFDPWFVLGGLLFGLVTLTVARARSRLGAR